MPGVARRLPAGWRDAAFVAIVLAATLFGIGTPLVQTFTATKYQTAAGQLTAPLSGPANMVSKGAPILIVALCLVVIALALTEAVPRSGFPALAVLVAPWMYLVVHDKSLGISPHLRVLCYPLICTAIWCLRPKLSSLRWVGYVAGGVAVLSLMIAFLAPQKGLYQAADGTEIAPDKAILSGILVGPLASGNNLGQFLLMGTAPILLIPRRAWRRLLLVACLWAQLWAASRSCLAAAGLLIVLAALMRWSPRKAAAAI